MHASSVQNRSPMALLLHLLLCALLPGAPPDSVRTVGGYRGIWFTLGQPSAYGDKYSGGLGTYTANHRPLAVYAPAARKTFFVYGGTPRADARRLLAMIGTYDHDTGLLSRPVVVHDKETVDDPHDNPALSIDEQGYLYVFVSGRAAQRPGFVYRSRRPYDTGGFELLYEGAFAYPQPWRRAGGGFLLLLTRYTHGREMYWATSPDGRTWAPPRKLVEGGHYQSSAAFGGRVGTAYNVHLPASDADTRTNLYYLETPDGGASWQTVDGRPVRTPLAELDTLALVHDYRREGLLVYLHDLAYDRQGRPAMLYTTSRDHRPGPGGAPRTWTVARWDGARWRIHPVAPAGHNYDTGMLTVEPDGAWQIVGPTEPGPQPWGTGGEIALWRSLDEGQTWARTRRLTAGSPYNHSYVRHPLNAHPDFYAFWADGDADGLSPSHLYFSDRTGARVFRMPYDMAGPFAAPEPYAPPPPRREGTP